MRTRATKEAIAAGKDADGKGGRGFSQGKLGTLRTGRAMRQFGRIRVDIPGRRLPVNQLGKVVGAGANLLVMPGDPRGGSDDRQSIRTSDLGLNPPPRRQSGARCRCRRRRKSAGRPS